MSTNIRKIKIWWESNKEAVKKITIIILVAVAGIGIGYLLGQDSSPAPIIIETMSHQ